MGKHRRPESEPEHTEGTPRTGDGRTQGRKIGRAAVDVKTSNGASLARKGGLAGMFGKKSR
jgi:hypothetical protein